MADEYFLKYDASVRFGSSEHYYHFLWGYLLPSLNEIIAIESNGGSTRPERRYLFASCGPVMDKITHEALSLYDCSHEIIKTPRPDAHGAVTEVVVPRWDVWLLGLSATNAFRRYLDDPDITDRYAPLLRCDSFSSDFLASIGRVKTRTIEKVACRGRVAPSDCLTESFLILQRSPQHKYYEVGGKAEIPTYGTARRSLTGIQEAVQELADQGIPVRVFEPGRQSLADQIMAFGNCRGVIGVIGAEFANVIWMKSRTRVILIRPSASDVPSLTSTLARMLQLDFSEMTTDEGSFPELNAGSVAALIR